MEPTDWFTQLEAALPAPDDAEALRVTSEERDALLDLARIAAHTSERWTAPVSTFLVGVAFATATPDERLAAVRALVARFDPDA